MLKLRSESTEILISVSSTRIVRFGFTGALTGTEDAAWTPSASLRAEFSFVDGILWEDHVKRAMLGTGAVAIVDQAKQNVLEKALKESALLWSTGGGYMGLLRTEPPMWEVVRPILLGRIANEDGSGPRLELTFEGFAASRSESENTCNPTLERFTNSELPLSGSYDLSFRQGYEAVAPDVDWPTIAGPISGPSAPHPGFDV